MTCSALLAAVLRRGLGRITVMCMRILASVCAVVALAAGETAPLRRPVPVEAECCTTTGTIVPPTTAVHTPGAEASERSYVELPPGASLDLILPVRADSLVLRYSYPDAPGGGGEDGHLEIRVGSASIPLPVTSRYSHVYGPGRFNTEQVWSQDPRDGQHRCHWHEASLRFAVQPARAQVQVVNPAGAGRSVLVDVAEFELVPPPVPLPAGALRFAGVARFGDGVSDATAAVQQAIDTCNRDGRTLYLPEGIYQVGTLTLGAMRLQGAGMWRTRLVGAGSRLAFTRQMATVADLAIFGETANRNDRSAADDAVVGLPGPGSRLERLWIERKKCAYWASPSEGQVVRGLSVVGCRLRNLYADGINLYSGATDCVVEDCLVRNTGDDALASWSPAAQGRVSGGIVFRRNLVQSPWLASGIALYGGGPFTVIDNEIRDTVYSGSGIYVSANFQAAPFRGEVRITGNRLVRCGSLAGHLAVPAGAIRILAHDGDMTAARFAVVGNHVEAPLASAISLHGPYTIANLRVEDLTVVAAGSAPLVDVHASAKGAAVCGPIACSERTGPSWAVAGGGFTLVSQAAGGEASVPTWLRPQTRSVAGAVHVTNPNSTPLEVALWRGGSEAGPVVRLAGGGSADLASGDGTAALILSYGAPGDGRTCLVAVPGEPMPGDARPR